MNISAPQYSKSTVGLRQPSEIKDQHLKLVFVYPIIIDKSVAKHEAIIRSFLSVSMIKEIFISNALNLVNIVSQIHPLTDERGNEVNIRSGLVDVTSFTGSGANGNFNAIASNMKAHPLEHLKQPLQAKIHEKLATIQKFMENDPKITSLNPYIEMITLDNMVDVPVIVGTKKLDINTSSLQFILWVAAAENKTINSNNIKFIIDKVKSIRPEDAYSVMKQSIPTEGSKIRKELGDYFKSLPGYSTISGAISNTTQKVSSWASKNFEDITGSPLGTRIKDDYTSAKNQVAPFGRSMKDIQTKLRAIPEFDSEDATMALVNSQKEINIAAGVFEKCLDPLKMQTLTGMNIAGGQMSSKFSKMEPRLSSEFKIFYNDFLSSMGSVANPLILSILYTMFPKETNVDATDIFNTRIQSDLFSKLDNLVQNDLLINLNATFQNREGVSGQNDSLSVIASLKQVCKKINNIDGVLSTVHSSLNGSGYNRPSILRSTDFTENELTSFIENLTNLSTKCASENTKLRYALDEILDNKASTVLERVFSIIIESIGKMLDDFSPYYTKIDPYSNVAFITQSPRFMANKSGDLVSRMRKDLVDGTASVVFFLFLYHLLVSLCNYVNIVEVEVETTKNDVLDVPNFTLVIPVQMVMSLVSSLVARGWNDMLKEGGIITTITENNIKRVIMFLKKRLGIPNLIVIDNETVYYSLMYQSEIQKSNITALSTFVNNITKQELKGTYQ